jgi:uncharacterized membrane protein
LTVLVWALDPYVQDWLDILLRLLHVIAAIAWIGSSFYFVLLDQSLRTPASKEDADAGVAGELWEVHGGGFYQVQKYRVAPSRLPDHLAWFKWEAYTTWLSGFALMIVLYYLDARSSLIDPTVADLEPWQAVTLSVGLVAAAWLIYDGLCRVVKDDRALAAALVLLVVTSAWAVTELFSPRAAFLQIGAMLGTIMAANVLFSIIPAHRKLVAAVKAGREPDPAPGIAAKRRSVHNNYLTLPVLLTMLAGHAAFLYTSEYGWLVLVALMALGVLARLFFNLRHGGRTHWWMIPVAAAAIAVLAVLIEPDDEPAGAPPNADQIAVGAQLFTTVGCSECHTLAAADAGGTVGPNLDGAAPNEAEVIRVVTNGSRVMPAFRSALSEQEISALAAFVSESASR